VSSAGLDTDPADMVAEMERFREDLQLFVTAKMIEVLWPF
jgi:hypothetical protein